MTTGKLINSEIGRRLGYGVDAIDRLSLYTYTVQYRYSMYTVRRVAFFIAVAFFANTVLTTEIAR